MVYAGSSTLGGQPQLSPPALMDIHTQLDAVLVKLEKAVMDVIKDVDAKKKVKVREDRDGLSTKTNWAPSHKTD